MQRLTTILDWIRHCTSVLSRPEIDAELVFGHGCLNAFDEAHALVLGLLHLPFDLRVEYFGAQLTDEEIECLQDGLRQRIAEKKPVPYITHRAMFMGLEFYVDERVLIPRSPMMQLIDNAFAPYIDDASQTVHSVLDLCCGSGCIGIATAYLLPNAEVIVADIDEDALDVANINIAKHDIADQVTAVASDVFDGLADCRFDLIIANPPYVDDDTVAQLPEEFLHEPTIALGADDNGLAVVKRILREAINHLNETGILIVEVGASWDILESAYPDVVFNWHDLGAGVEGVFVMSYDELASYQAIFQNA